MKTIDDQLGKKKQMGWEGVGEEPPCPSKLFSTRYTYLIFASLLLIELRPVTG